MKDDKPFKVGDDVTIIYYSGGMLIRKIKSITPKRNDIVLENFDRSFDCNGYLRTYFHTDGAHLEHTTPKHRDQIQRMKVLETLRRFNFDSLKTEDLIRIEETIKPYFVTVQPLNPIKTKEKK